MGAISHVYNQTVADGGATSVVRPSDWNSAHNQFHTILGNTGGTSTFSGTNLVFAGGNNLTLSMSGSTLSFIGPAAASESFGISNLGNTSGTSGIASGSGVGQYFAGGNNVTLSQSVNGASATITISAGGATLSTYEPYPIQNTGTGAISAQTATSNNGSFFPFIVDNYVSAGMLNLAASMSFVTMGTSSGQQSATYAFGLYTRGTGTNSTTLASLASTSFGLNVTYNNSTISISQPTTSNYTGYATGSTSSGGLNLSSGYTGMKMIQVPINTLMTPGQYWLGVHCRESTSSNSGGIKATFVGNQISLSAMAPIGSFSSNYTAGTNVNAQRAGPWLMAGVASAQVTKLPDTLAVSDMSMNLSVIPYMRFIST